MPFNKTHAIENLFMALIFNKPDSILNKFHKFLRIEILYYGTHIFKAFIYTYIDIYLKNLQQHLVQHIHL